MAYFNTCRFCGSNLDPQEKCDCKEKQEQNEIVFMAHLKQDDNGQISFAFEDSEKTKIC